MVGLNVTYFKLDYYLVKVLTLTYNESIILPIVLNPPSPTLVSSRCVWGFNFPNAQIAKFSVLLIGCPMCNTCQKSIILGKLVSLQLLDIQRKA